MDEETSSLPTQDSDISDSDLHTYVLRITPYEKFSFQQVADLFKENGYYLNYVLSRETVPREHFHAVLQTDTNYDLEMVRGDIRSFLIPHWETTDHKLPRGFGNKQYNLQLADDLDRAVSYAVKQNEILFEGFTEDYITQRKTESFEKKKPSNFKSEYIDLSNRFQDSDMDVREFMINYCDLKAKYDQLVNLQHAYGYALSNSIKRDKNASEYVENFLYKYS